MSFAKHLGKHLQARDGEPARLLVFLWVVAALPWLTFTKTIPYDAKDEFYPGVVFTVRSLLRGEAPFWNPFLYSGYPSFADPQAMTFSPSVVLPMLLSQSIVWFDIVILVHLLFGGIGMLRLGRSYSWANSASLVAAIVFMFGGVASSRLQHTPMIVTWSFLPWVLVAVRALFHESSWRAVLALGLAGGFAALQLTQVTYLTLLVASAYAIYRLGGTALAEGRRTAFTIGVRLAVAATLALLIAAPQLIATLHVLPFSNRADLDPSFVHANSLSLAAYATLISPNALGNLSGKYVGPNDITETFLYLGAFPLAILIGGLSGRRQGLGLGETWFWTLAIIFSVLYALGSATPFFALMYEYLPGIQYFRRPTDAAFLFVFCAAVLIGASMDPAREVAGAGTDTGQVMRVPAIGAIVGLSFVAALSICAWLGTEVSLLSLAMLGVGYLCYARARTATNPGGWIAALVVSIFVDLRIHNIGNRLNAHRVDEYSASVSLEQNAMMSFLAQRLREDGYYRIELQSGASEINAAESMGIASIGGLNPLVLKDYVTFVGMQTGSLSPRRRSGAFDSYHGRINDLLGVRYLAADDLKRTLIESELGPGYRIVAELERRVIWENRNALPRVLRPQYAIPAPPVSAFIPAMFNSVDLEESAYVEAPKDVLTKCAAGRARRATILRYSNNEVVVDVQADFAAWVVLNDVYFDGWRAEISGGEMPVFRANGIFRAVCVPPGEHLVRFVFQPYRYFLRKLWMTVSR